MKPFRTLLAPLLAAVLVLSILTPPADAEDIWVFDRVETWSRDDWDSNGGGDAGSYSRHSASESELGGKILRNLDGAEKEKWSWSFSLAKPPGTLRPGDTFELTVTGKLEGRGRFSYRQLTLKRTGGRFKVEGPRFLKLTPEKGSVSATYRYTVQPRPHFRFEGDYNIKFVLRTRDDIAWTEWIYRYDPTADPEPDPEPAPEPEPDPEPDPEPIPEPVPEPEPEEVEPDPADVAAIAKLKRMLALLEGIEDELQGALMAVRLYTEVIVHKEAEAARVKAIRDGTDDRSLKQKAGSRLAGLEADLKPLRSDRQKLIDDALALIERAIMEIEALHIGGGFGELQPEADRILRATLDRRDFFQAQAYMVTGESDKLLALGRRVRGNLFGKAKGLYFQGLAHRMAGDKLKALQALREARQAGLGGEVSEAIERQLEVELIEALQAGSVGVRARFEKEFERWIAAKAETERSPNKSRFGWFVERVLWRGWYDSVSGLSPWTEGHERARERGVIADDMAQLHVGLGIVKGLRKAGFPLSNIQTMTWQEFRTAVGKTWEHELNEGDARRMRQVMMRAFQLPDLKTLASDKDLSMPGVMSGRFVQETESDLMTQAAEWGAAAGNILNGWTVATALVPAARLGSGAKAVTMAEFFAASRPVGTAVSKIAALPGGNKMLAGLARIHDWSEASRLGAGTTIVGSALVEGGAAYAAEQAFGQNARYLVDALGMMGGFSPELYTKAFRRAGLTGSRLQQLSRSLSSRAATRKAALEPAEEALAEARRLAAEASEGAVDPAQVRTLKEAVEELSEEVPADVSRSLRRTVDELDGGSAARAQHHVDQAQRGAQRASQQLSEAEQAARGLEEAAGRVGEPGVTPGHRSIEEPGATRTGPRSGAAGETPAPPPTSGSRNYPQEAPRFLAAQERALTREADRLMTQGKFAEAAELYEELLTRHGSRHRFSEVFEKRRDLALKARAHAEDLARRRAAAENVPGARPEVPRGLSGEVEEQVGKAVRQGHQVPADVPAADLPHLEKVSHRKGGGPTAADPDFAIASGRDIAVLKEPINQSSSFRGHPDHVGEELASRLRGIMGRRGPNTRLMDLDGTRRLVTEAFPPGKDLGDWLDDLIRSGKQDEVVPILLAHKEELTEDLVVSLLLGDGDRHFNNVYRTLHGDLIPFDHGLADLLPTHPYRNADELGKIMRKKREIQALTSMGDDLSADALKELEGELRLLERQEEFYGLYHDPGVELPPPVGSPDFDRYLDSSQFDDFVAATTEKHFRHALRDWQHYGDEWLMSAVRREDLTHHLKAIQQQRGELGRLVEQVMPDADPQLRKYTSKLLEKRLEVMERLFEERFPSIPDQAFLWRLPSLNRAA